MPSARLVVVDGPDAGAEFAVPPGGGGIGRGEGNAVQLSDLSVSRTHCALEPRADRLAIVDVGGRNRTVVNGRPVTEHLLADGDEISIGRTRLVYLPPEGGLAVVPTAAHARVTMELRGDDLLRRASQAVRSAAPPAAGARRHLAALARLGDGLRRAPDRAAAVRIACEALRDALAADRTLLLLRDAVGRLAPAAAAAADGEAAGAGLALPRDVVDKVVREGKALLFESAAGRPALAAPLPAADERAEAPGLLHADARAGSSPWEEADLEMATCAAHLVAAALEGHAAREALARENRALEERLGASGEFVGDSPAARAILAFIAKVGPTDSTVLLLGESGVGKELVASSIHRASRRPGGGRGRAAGPFVCVNCAALTETLLVSELFGHEKGAFTGATERKIGRFELADGGTLFLDEVGELSPRAQTMLLRVLEDRRVERIGGARPIAVDVRIVAATNRRLDQLAQRGEFREDLYYRLSVIGAEIPPLRERRDDIPALCEHLLARLSFQVGRRVAGFAPEALRALVAWSWPGNVRELRNVLERALVLGDGDRIRLEDLPPALVAAAPLALVPPTAPHAFAPPPPAPHAFAPPPPAPHAFAPPPPAPHAFAPPPTAPHASAAPPPPALVRSLRALERDAIVAALAATRGNKAQAAALLEIDRSTLYKKLKDFGIDT